MCSYDRAGRGWSDPDPDSPTLSRTVADLHALLREADLAPPYVLVGHSLGGVYVRGYAAEHPEEVSGLVLVDSSHPDQLERYPELLEMSESFGRLLRTFPAMARIGLFQLYFDAGGELDLGPLPAAQRTEATAFP